MAHPQECSPRQGARWRLQRPRMDNMRTAMADDGARSGNRTRIPFRMRDFKSLASTSFAIRANEERYTRCCKRRRTITSPPGSRNPNEWPLRACRQSRFQAHAQAVVHSKKKPASVNLRVFQHWRPMSESNRRTRICNPLHNHSANRPQTITPQTEAASSSTNWSGKRD